MCSGASSRASGRPSSRRAISAIAALFDSSGSKCGSAARALQRPVRVVLTRPQMYGLGYRPAMLQRIALGAKADGTLAAITNDAITVTSQYEDFHRQETGWSGLLYKCDNAQYAHRLARLDLATSCDMRAPSAASAVYALESAMDARAVVHLTVPRKSVCGILYRARRTHSARFKPESPVTTEALPPSPKSSTHASPAAFPAVELQVHPVSLIGPET